MLNLNRAKFISTIVLLLTTGIGLPLGTLGLVAITNGNVAYGFFYVAGVMLLTSVARKIVKLATPDWPRWMFDN